MQRLTLKQSLFSRLQQATLFGISLAIAASGLALFNPQKASAANGDDFNPGRIIDDDKFTKTSTMTASQIQDFLEEMGQDCVSNCIKNYTQDGKKASSIIRQAALDYDINPQVLIVLLQKEQGLITDTSPDSYSYKYATGYCVTDSGLCGNWWGFTKQVRKAAQLFRYIIDNPDESNYPPGSRQVQYHPNAACGTKTVNIQTKATAALYHYTPYTPNQAALNNMYGTGNGCSSYGNRNFWRYFVDWFGSTRGAYRLIECSGNKYLIESYIPTKRLLTDTAVAEWGLTESYFKPDDSSCSYPTYALSLERLVKSRDSGKSYMVDNETAHTVHSSSIARAWGFDLSNIPQLNGSTISSLPITSQLSRLARSDTTDIVYWLDDGNRHAIVGSPNGSPSLSLIRGDGKVPMSTFSSDAISPLTRLEDIDYSFKVGSIWYVFDYGMIRAISSYYYDPRWAHVDDLTGPTLSVDAKNVMRRGITLQKGFQRSSKYYVVRNGDNDPQVYSSTSKAQASFWSVDDSPTITSLLLNKVVN